MLIGLKWLQIKMLVDNIGGMRYNITEENKNAGMAELADAQDLDDDTSVENWICNNFGFHDLIL